MLGGPTWSGSIQQDLIEKLWVAILTCDAAAPTTSREPPGGKGDTKASETGIAAASGEISSESDSDSEDTDIDSDIDFSELESGLALVNRNDLFSIAKLKQRQSDAAESSVTASANSVFDYPGDTNILKEDDKLPSVPPQSGEGLGHGITGERKANSEASSPIACGSSSASASRSSSRQSGATPKVSRTPSTKNTNQGRRPRPDTLNFNDPVKSRVPHISPVSPNNASRKFDRKKTEKCNVSHAPGKRTMDQKRPSNVTQGKTSKSPLSPKRHAKPFNLQVQDRAHLLDVVPRKRLWSDPHQKSRFEKSSPIIWRRRAVTPEAAKPFAMRRQSSEKGDAEKPDTRPYLQRRCMSLRSNSISCSTQKKETRPIRVDSFTKSTASKPRVDSKVDKVTREPGKWKQSNGEKQGKAKVPVSPVSPVSPQPQAPGRKNVVRKPLRDKALSVDASRFPSRWINSPKTDNFSSPFNQKRLQRAKSDARDIYPPQERGKIDVKRVSKHAKAAEGKSAKTEVKTEVITEVIAEAKTEQSSEGQVEEDIASPIQEAKINSDLADTACYGATAEVSRLEDCLKEAILGVLQGLPEGWILVPEHTAELFCSLDSVVESFPRPSQARARVLEAIVDAHSRRPCGKGEIAALNNAHLLLYVGLKFCCVRAGKAVEDEKQKEEEMTAQKKIIRSQVSKWGLDSTDDPQEAAAVSEKCEPRDDTTDVNLMHSEHDKNATDEEKDACSLSEDQNQSSDVDVEVKLAQRGIVLKILTEIQRCEGSFDRLMMCLLLGSRAPGRGSGWYCETEGESEKVRDLRFVLNHLKFVDGCRVSEVVSAPLWSCGSSPVVLAALAESPQLVLALLQYGAGGSAANHYLYSKCYTNGVYLAIAYLVRKLESQFKESPTQDNQQHPEGGDDQRPVVGDAERQASLPEGGADGQAHSARDEPSRCDLLTLADHTPTAACLRYLLRAVPRVPIKFLRDQLGGCGRDCGRDVAYLLPHTCCLQPPTLTHLSRAACRQYLRIHDLLPQIIEDLDVPQTLKDYLKLLRD